MTITSTAPAATREAPLILDAAFLRTTGTLLGSFEGTYVRHTQTQEIERNLELLLAYGPPDGKTMRSARTYLLVGAAGAGKSTILKKFRDRHPPVEERDWLRIEVVYAEVPASGTRSGVLRAILKSIGVHVHSRAT